MKKGAALFFCLLVSLFLMGAGMAQDAADNLKQETTIQKLQNQIHQLLKLQARQLPPVDREMDMAITTAPTLVGTWKGTVPTMDINGVCSNQTVVLTIKQCGNLLSGTCKIGTLPLIKVVGKYSSYISMGGSLSQTSPYLYLSISFSGNYVETPSPRISVTYFYFYSSTTDYEFNTPFTLVKQ